MDVFAFMKKLLDALVVFSAYLSGRHDARLSTAKEQARNARRAKKIADRVASDPAYAARVRERFTRKR